MLKGAWIGPTAMKIRLGFVKGIPACSMGSDWKLEL